ncbi:hypothetical protein ACU4HD_43785 [Cupriavidus basilensis]
MVPSTFGSTTAVTPWDAASSRMKSPTFLPSATSVYDRLRQRSSAACTTAAVVSQPQARR